jgi:tetratricopeptide (TPR) repeat protein
LKVISRTSVMTFKGTSTALRTIAEELKVRYVLEGSVRRAGESLRISAQLIDATNDTHLWAGQYPGTLDDVFDMQEKVSRAIVEALQLKLTPAEERQIARRPITNVQAYDCYLRARNAIVLWTEQSTNEASKLLEAGLKLSGDNALLYAGLGYVHYQYANLGLRQVETPEEAWRKAEAYAEQALRLDPETAQAQMVLGQLAGVPGGNNRQAVEHLKQALSINPNDIDALWWLLSVYNFVGKTSAARSVADRMMEIDPLNILNANGRGWLHFFEGQFDLSVESHRRCLAVADVPVARFCLAFALSARGRSKEALAVLTPLGPAMRYDVNVQSCRLLRLALEGEKEKVAELMSSQFRATTRIDCLYSIWVADSYAMLGEREQALEWLENAVNRNFINYPYLSEYDPFLARLRSDPRFQKLMVRVKSEWERFEP